MFPAIIVSLFHCFGGGLYFPGGEPDSRWIIEPEYSAVSADGKTSAVTMGIERGESIAWQIWVVQPGSDGRYVAYRLPGEPAGEDCYGPTLHFSPGGLYLFEDRKTGSGNNFAAVYSLKDGKYLIDSEKNRQTQKAPMSELLRSFFGESTELGDPFDHYWVFWKAWNKDGVSVEADISASHCDGDFHVNGWRANFNIETGEFYLTQAQAVFNRRTIRFQKRIPKEDRVFRSAVGLPEKPAR